MQRPRLDRGSAVAIRLTRLINRTVKNQGSPFENLEAPLDFGRRTFKFAIGLEGANGLPEQGDIALQLYDLFECAD